MKMLVKVFLAKYVTKLEVIKGVLAKTEYNK